MAAHISANPRCLLVTVPSSTPVKLYDLLAAIDAQIPRVAQCVQLQAAIGNADALVFVGNSDLNTTTNWGLELQAGQPYPIYSMGANLIQLDEIYLATDGSNAKVGVSIITR